MVSKGLTRGREAGRTGVFRGPKAVIPGRCEASNPESRESGFAPSGAPRNDSRVEGSYFALSILVTVYPEAASSASKVTLSPTFTCFSMAGSLTR